MHLRCSWRLVALWRRLLIVGRRFLSRWMSLASSSVLARLRCILLILLVACILRVRLLVVVRTVGVPLLPVGCLLLSRHGLILLLRHFARSPLLCRRLYRICRLRSCFWLWSIRRRWWRWSGILRGRLGVRSLPGGAALCRGAVVLLPGLNRRGPRLLLLKLLLRLLRGLLPLLLIGRTRRDRFLCRHIAVRLGP